MKFAAALLSFVSAAFAQSVYIASPPDNTTVTAGGYVSVSIAKPDSLTFTDDVSVAIGIRTCGDNPSCRSVGTGLFNVVYKGDYDPQIIMGSGRSTEYQNYTVQVPSFLPAGPALINVVHFFLSGADLQGTMETVQSTIYVVTTD